LPVVFMALGGIGLPGGAVYIDRSLLRSRWWGTAVSLAGPAMNLLLIALLGAAFRTGLIPPDPSNLSTISLAFLLRLEVYALILNLLPVPPLDGFQAIAPWLPDDLRERLYGFANTGMFAVFMVLWFVPPAGKAFSAIVSAICEVAGVETLWAALGYRAFRFWEH